MIWIVFYGMLILIFISGILCFLKKKKVGTVTVILTPIFLIWSILYMLHRDWVGGQTEIAYFMEELESLSIQAFALLGLFITLVGLLIYNITILLKENYEK